MASGLAAVLFAIMPFFVAILAHLNIEGERLTVLKVIGMLIGFGGILLIFADSLGTEGKLGVLGMVAIVLACFSSSSATILSKKHFHHLNLLPLTAFQTGIGAIILLALGFISEPLSIQKMSTRTIGSIFYLAIFGTAIAFSLYLYLLKRMEATKISMIAFITPLMALILGILFQNETFNLLSILGSFMVISGVFIVVMGDNIRKSHFAKKI